MSIVLRRGIISNRRTADLNVIPTGLTLDSSSHTETIYVETPNYNEWSLPPFVGVNWVSHIKTSDRTIEVSVLENQGTNSRSYSFDILSDYSPSHSFMVEQEGAEEPPNFSNNDLLLQVHNIGNYQMVIDFDQNGFIMGYDNSNGDYYVKFQINDGTDNVAVDIDVTFGFNNTYDTYSAGTITSPSSGYKLYQDNITNYGMLTRPPYSTPLYMRFTIDQNIEK